MGEERGQMTFYRSYFEALSSLPKKDRLAAYEAIVAYGLDGAEPKLSGVPLTVFLLVKPTLDTGRRKAKSGKAGGESSGTGKQTGSKPEANESNGEARGTGKQTGREKEKEKEIEKENEKENEKEVEREKEIEGTASLEEDRTEAQLLEIQRAWNDLDAPKVKQVLSLSRQQKDGLRKNLSLFGREKLLEAVGKVKKSEFLVGEKSGFVITFDWFLGYDHLRQILAGRYDGRTSETTEDDFAARVMAGARESVRRMQGKDGNNGTI